MRLTFILLFVFNGFSILFSQTLTGIAAYYDDAFSEWEVFIEEEEIVGELRQRWEMNNNWTEWDYQIDDLRGSIQLNWKDDPTQWTVRGYESTVTCRALWRDNLTEWRITDNDIALTLQIRWANNRNEWRIREKTYGRFEIYTNRENDPRDWTIIDELSEEISLDMKMAISFIAVFHSFPK